MAPSEMQRGARAAGQHQHQQQHGVSNNTSGGGQMNRDAGMPASSQRRHDGQWSHEGASSSRPNRELMPATAESWIEVASQPSSSSLSSIGDEIVTTGLRVGTGAGASYPPRRRRPHAQQHQHQQPMPGSFIIGHPATQTGATSSQEEYDETESEEDRVMTSSTEAAHPASAHVLRQHTAVRASATVESDSDDDDVDENATALGRRPSDHTPVFRPQPNAFSHPPSHLTHRHSTASAPPHSHPHSGAYSSRPHARPHHHRGPPNYMSPSYQADNDAALRASLTTLLSCAAAARGLPKTDDGLTTAGAAGVGAGVVPGSQPMELRLVPESELMATDNTAPPPARRPSRRQAATTNTTTNTSHSPPTTTTRTPSNSSSPSGPSSHNGRDNKRAAGTTPSGAAGASTKKKRSLQHGGDSSSSSETLIFNLSPTLLTWVVSAGVVVLVSVVGFGAGYVLGREVGRQEGGAGGVVSSLTGAGATSTGGGGIATNASAGCGGELLGAGSSAVGGGGTGTLRRMRWGGVGRSVTA
ncbi:hypothetical protein B0J18DRAFT_253888 [Chaetomium sp. MPI-SDFR-AT-0129]|nr:hypothetical protein B0J18DRAFT_253888 [Chaetomium sp. MPI-SDFR-AT-0129]